ncbi:C-type lectin domain family 2 member G-like isoform X1 [Apodemus sylvaticus]|uniref:C-type lectin domain family 2 member G-like isoform X1 n=2 Tax=Apodemus sylvaticus TaxID=10129 RepID=UPI00224311E5|nr:C-type lectin domain family 2 member G-like isoform X1 [Apodemus sylvaticus]
MCLREVQPTENLFVHNMNAQCLQKPGEDNGSPGTGAVHCFISPESPAKLYCCYGVITVLSAAVVALSVALSVRTTEQISIKNIYAACPTKWIGFGNKCFYFSEDLSNWTSSQTFCREQEAQLTQFDNVEELEFLKRYKGIFDYWIGLHRESSEGPWRWTDNTEYNSVVPIRGVERYAYLNNNGISTARIYADRRWICSKLNNHSLHCQIPFSSVQL